MSFHAINGRVLIKPDEQETRTKGGLFIPDTAKRDRVMTGTVRFVGPGTVMPDGKRWPIDPDIKPGARVLYPDQPWPTVEIAGETLVKIQDADAILGIVEQG